MEPPYKLLPICEAKGLTIFQCWYNCPLVLVNGVFLLILLLREIIEFLSAVFLSSTGWSYLTISNFFQLFEIILSTTFIFLVPNDMELANHFGAWAVFIAWINVSRFLSMIDFVGEYMNMAWNIIGIKK